MDKKEEDPKAEIELAEVGQSNENREKEREEREEGEEGEEQKEDEEKRGDSQEDEGVEVAKLKSKGKGKKKFKLTFENCNPLDKIPQRVQLLFGLLFNLVTSFLGISAFIIWMIQTNQFSDVIDNWTLAPITDVQFVPATTNCPVNYETLSGNFFGTNLICDCGPKNIIQGGCSGVKLASCTEVQTINPFQFYNWRPFHICVARHPSESFVNARNRPRSCSMEGWKSCSNSTGTEPVCVPENTPCPITSIQVVFGGGSGCPSDFEATSFTSENQTWSICTQRQAGYPLVNAAITLGGKCYAGYADINPYSATTYQNPTIVLSTTGKPTVDLSLPIPICGDNSERDTRYTDIDTRQMGLLFKDNYESFANRTFDQTTLNYWTENKYPLYYKFQVRSEIPWKDDCEMSREDVAQLEFKLRLITVSQTGLALLSLIVGLCINIPWACWAFTCGYDDVDVKTPAFWGKTTLSILAVAAKIVLLVIALLEIYGLKTSFLQLHELGCGDSSSESIINFYAEQLSRLSWFDLVLIALCVIEIGVDLRSMFVLPTKKERKFAIRLKRSPSSKMDDAFVPEADELDYVPQVYQGFCPQCGVALQYTVNSPAPVIVICFRCHAQTTFQGLQGYDYQYEDEDQDQGYHYQGFSPVRQDDTRSQHSTHTQKSQHSQKSLQHQYQPQPQIQNQIPHTNLQHSPLEAKEPAEIIPPGWEKSFTPDGRCYYIHQATKKIVWEKPTQ